MQSFSVFKSLSLVRNNFPRFLCRAISKANISIYGFLHYVTSTRRCTFAYVACFLIGVRKEMNRSGFSRYEWKRWNVQHISALQVFHLMPFLQFCSACQSLIVTYVFLHYQMSHCKTAITQECSAIKRVCANAKRAYARTFSLYPFILLQQADIPLFFLMYLLLKKTFC